MSTPARRLRDAAAADAQREAGRRANEDKAVLFRLGCEQSPPPPPPPGAAPSERDLERARDRSAACNSLGEWLLLMRSDAQGAARAFAAPCLEQRHAPACLNLGRLLQASGEPAVAAAALAALAPPAAAAALPAPARGEPPEALALRALSLGCEEGNADACADAARLHLRRARGAPAAPEPLAAPLRADMLAAAALLQRGCSAGAGVSHGKCCGLLAAMHLGTRGNELFASPEPAPAPALAPPLLPPARALAPPALLALLERACGEGEEAAACARLAAVYRPLPAGAGAAGAAPSAGARFFGVAPDAARARELERRGLVWAGLSEAQAERQAARRGR
jgi:hypothetical protein